MTTTARNHVTWRCDQCRTDYGTEREALRCEDRHKQVKVRAAAYQEALTQSKPMIGRFREQEDGSFALSGVFLVLKVIEEKRTSVRFQAIEDEVRYTMTDAYQCFDEFLPEPGSKYHGYVSIMEAVAAGWCPFFSQHYQNTWPLAIREQIADAFLALPEDIQQQHLLARRPMTRHSSENE